MRDTPRMDIFAACCVPVFVKSLKEVFFLFGRKAKLPDKKDAYNCFLKTCQILCQHEWVGPWSLVSANCRKTHTDTHWTTWQQSGNKPISAFCLKDVCVYIYIFIYLYVSYFIYIYKYIYIRRRNHIYIYIIYICLRGAENFRTWHEVSFCTNFVQGVEDCGELFSLLCTFKEVLSRCCRGFEDSALGYFMLFICLCNNSCTRV